MVTSQLYLTTAEELKTTIGPHGKSPEKNTWRSIQMHADKGREHRRLLLPFVCVDRAWVVATGPFP